MRDPYIFLFFPYFFSQIILAHIIIDFVSPPSEGGVFRCERNFFCELEIVRISPREKQFLYVVHARS